MNTAKYFQPILLIGEDLEKLIPKILISQNIKLDITSPDFIRISPEKEFAIADSRLVIKKASLSPLFSSHKVILVENFTKASTQAQNSLLKVLEEPPASTLIILLSNSKNNILPTILSRVITLDSGHRNNPQTAETENFISQITSKELSLGHKLMLIDKTKEPELKLLIKDMLICLNRPDLNTQETFLAKSLLDVGSILQINVRARLILDNIIIALDQSLKK